MLWIREEKILSGSDDGPASQRCRELNLDGMCGDVRREDPEASPPLFYHHLYLVMGLAMAMFPLDWIQEHLAA